MTKRRVLFLFLSLTAAAFFLLGGWSKIAKVYFSYKLGRVWGADIQIQELKGGLIEGFSFKQIEMIWGKDFFLKKLYAKKANSGNTLLDFVQNKKNKNKIFFIDSILAQLQPAYKMKLNKPLPFFRKETIFTYEKQSIDNNLLQKSFVSHSTGRYESIHTNPKGAITTCERPGKQYKFPVIRVTSEQITLENVQKAFIHFGQIFVESYQDVSGLPGYKMLFRTPRWGHQNKIYLNHSAGLKRVVITDYSLRELSGLMRPVQVLDGIVHGEMIMAKRKIKKVHLKVKNMHLRLSEDQEIQMDLDLKYENGCLTIEHCKWISGNFKIVLKGTIEQLLKKPILHLESKCTVLRHQLNLKLEGPLKQCQFQGEQISPTRRAKWNLQLGRIYFEPEGIKIEKAKGDIYFTTEKQSMNNSLYKKKFVSHNEDSAASLHSTSRPSSIDINERLSMDEWGPIAVKLDLLLTRNGLFVKNATIEDIVQVEGWIHHHREPFLDLSLAPVKNLKDKLNYEKSITINKCDIRLIETSEGFSLIGFGRARVFNRDFTIESKLANHKLKVHFQSVEKKSSESVRVDILGDIPRKNISIKSAWLHNKIQVEGKLKFSKWPSLNILKNQGKEKWDCRVKLNKLKIRDCLLPNGSGTLKYDSEKEGTVVLDELYLGKEYLIQGIYDLNQNRIKLELNFMKPDLSYFECLFPKDERPYLEGTVDGLIKLEGDPRYPRWEGRLNVHKGRFFDLKFDEVILNTQGYGTVVEFTNSSLIAPQGKWKIEGTVDLKKSHPFKQVKFAMDPGGMSLQGFQIKKDDYFGELTLLKQIDDKWAVSLKARSGLDDSLIREDESETEIQLEYEYLPNQDVLFRMDEDEQMFGVRKKVEF